MCENNYANFYLPPASIPPKEIRCFVLAFKAERVFLLIIIFSHFQSSLREIGESRMECDYKLVENEGLFQEYLEMGKKGPGPGG